MEKLTDNDGLEINVAHLSCRFPFAIRLVQLTYTPQKRRVSLGVSPCLVEFT